MKLRYILIKPVFIMNIDTFLEELKNNKEI